MTVLDLINSKLSAMKADEDKQRRAHARIKELEQAALQRAKDDICKMLEGMDYTCDPKYDFVISYGTKKYALEIVVTSSISTNEVFVRINLIYLDKCSYTTHSLERLENALANAIVGGHNGEME